MIALHGTSRVLSAISTCNNTKDSQKILSTVAVAQWVERWPIERKVLSVESSSIRVDCALTRKSDFHLSCYSKLESQTIVLLSKYIE